MSVEGSRKLVTYDLIAVEVLRTKLMEEYVVLQRMNVGFGELLHLFGAWVLHTGLLAPEEVEVCGSVHEHFSQLLTL